MATITYDSSVWLIGPSFWVEKLLDPVHLHNNLSNMKEELIICNKRFKLIAPLENFCKFQRLCDFFFNPTIQLFWLYHIETKCLCRYNVLFYFLFFLVSELKVLSSFCFKESPLYYPESLCQLWRLLQALYETCNRLIGIKVPVMICYIWNNISSFSEEQKIFLKSAIPCL